MTTPEAPAREPSAASPFRRFRPALAAGLTALALLAAMDVYARHQLRRHVRTLAALNLPENTRGSAVQRQIFGLPHCLPIYGSSELDILQPTRADLFFHGGGSGLRAEVIGKPGDRCLVMLQELAALGEAVRGKKVAIFLSPTWFQSHPEDGRRGHRRAAVIFSPQQAGRTLLAGALQPSTRRAIAARLLDYDEVVRDRSPLVLQALLGLRAPAWPERGRFFLVLPLLALQNGILGFQDRLHQTVLMYNHPEVLRTAGRSYRLRRKENDWPQILADVDRAARKHPAAVTFGKHHKPLAPADGPEAFATEPPSPRPDEEFLARLAGSAEWGDLDLLLRTLHELGARPLLINQPINGPASDRLGISPAARRRYYDRVAGIAARHRVPLGDFSAEEEDPAFFRDPVHPSAKAWVLYDRALAEFYAGEGG